MGWGVRRAVRGRGTAFWKPYKPDRYTYALFHFDTEKLVGAEGKISSGQILGGAQFSADGKFGGALSLGGRGAVKFQPSSLFTGCRVSIEAWVKLLKYPEKEAYIVYRPAVVDRDARYNPKVDRTHGFALLVDSKGAFHLQVTNTFYGRRTRTSSPEGIVPLNEWVHLAGISTNFRRLYLNGKEVVSVPVGWGRGLMGEEKEPGTIYIGNTEKLTAGIVGLIDEVRMHQAIFKLWEKEDAKWTESNAEREIPKQLPYFLPAHEPILWLPLDGDMRPVVSEVPSLRLATERGSFVRGVRNEGFEGKLKISAKPLLDLHEGSLEFWFEPVDANNYADYCLGFVSARGAFNIYFFNAGVIRGSPFPLSAYFYKSGRPYFVSDTLGTEFHEGRWYHIVLTWKGKERNLYIDGELAGSNTDETMSTEVNKGKSEEIVFQHTARFDEIYIYRKCLNEEEIRNCYFRYRDPAKLSEVKFKPVKIRALYMPYYQNRLEPLDSVGKVLLSLVNENGKEIRRKPAKLSEEEQILKLPDLEDGKYTLKAFCNDKSGKLVEGGRFEFERIHFEWENNTLGIMEEVYPPFEPIRVEGSKVGVVLREYEMNRFGVWSRVKSKGREILAEPMNFRCVTAKGEGKWEKLEGKFVERRSNLVVYQAEAVSRALRLKARSSIEIDGCMKVEMELLSGNEPIEIKKLWLEIPMKESCVRLFHEVTDGPRINYSGSLPEGNGIVWDSTRARRYHKWLNSFVPYIWLGGEERGLAWFAESDKGWITEKGESKVPLQEIAREDGKVVLRVYFINTPAVLSARRGFVFGLQASPTKPMPEKWREKLPSIPGGLPVTPWGGLHCSYQGPYHDDWSIADKIVESRYTEKVDKQWFKSYAEKHNPPPVHGTWDWLTSVCWFARWCARTGPEKPIACYQEEMGASTVRAEWRVFQHE